MDYKQARETPLTDEEAKQGTGGYLDLRTL